ncbi:MAG: class I SAM-dependent methyltransferase [Rhodospirillaceae bacterium]
MRTIGDILRGTPRMLTPVLRAYEKRLKRYGPTAQGVFWKNAEWQLRRYVLMEAIFDAPAQAGGITIHDFGCGYGSLFDHLADKPVMQMSRYIGTDMSQAMIDAAQARHTDPRATFVRGVAAREMADYTLISGTYNMHMGADADDWVDYIQASLQQLWRHTQRGLAFNLLGHDAAEQFHGLFYADPDAFRAFARTQRSPDAWLACDAPLPDFTIFVRRPAA